MKRRDFLKATAVGVPLLATSFEGLLRKARANTQYFCLHPFIEGHPEAVFIKRTQVAAKTDSEAKKQEGLRFAQEIFSLGDAPGIPLSHRMTIKPNLTASYGVAKTEEGMGIITDRYFMEGLVTGIIGQGFSADKIYLREGNYLGDGYIPNEWSTTGYEEIAAGTGIHFADFPTGRKLYELTHDTLVQGSEVTWIDCPDGNVFNRLGYVAPFGQEDTWLLNVAKLKAHGMGLTLSSKNLQGAAVPPYIHFCEGAEASKKRPANVLQNFRPDFEENVQQLYAKHVADGIPRWDRPKMSGLSGYEMEQWAQRACDSLSVLKSGLSIIEGIYARNGNGFLAGPGPDGKAQDFLTNLLIFGKNPLLVDVIGYWLGGHEPGNFGFFHIAKERGLLTVLNPADIPLYTWENGDPKAASLTDFERTPILTYYLQRNYNGQNEAQYHLVNEPYEYTSVADAGNEAGLPSTYILEQNYPNPFNASTRIEFSLPRDGHVLLEVYDALGQKVDVLENRWLKSGTHLATWSAVQNASGIYWCHLKAGDFQASKSMLLLR